jgi:hypothetical protein
MLQNYDNVSFEKRERRERDGVKKRIQALTGANRRSSLSILVSNTAQSDHNSENKQIG